MSQKLEQLIQLFEQLEAWDTQGRSSVSAPNMPEPSQGINTSNMETPLSRMANQYGELTNQIRELADNEQSDEVLHYLVDRLKHPNVAVRLQAAEALGYTGNPDAIAALIDAMRDDMDYGVQAGAAQSLGIIGSTLATSALGEVLQKDILQAGEVKVH